MEFVNRFVMYKKNIYCKSFLIFITALFLPANLIIYWYGIIPFSTNIDLTRDNAKYEFPLKFVPPGNNTYAISLNIPHLKHENLFPAIAGSEKRDLDIRDLDIILSIAVIGRDKQTVFNEEGLIKYWAPTNMPIPNGSNETLYKPCGVPTAYAKEFAKKELNIDLADMPCFRSELFKRYTLQITVVRGNSKAAVFKPLFFIFPKLMGEEKLGMLLFVNGILLILLFSSSLFSLIYIYLRKYLKKRNDI